MKQMEEKNKTISVIKGTLEKALMTIGTSEDKEKAKKWVRQKNEGYTDPGPCMNKFCQH